MEVNHVGFMILAILLARIIPKGIIGVVLVSVILAYTVSGIRDTVSLSLLFILPIIISLMITPECLTLYTHRNREYYGSTFNMCNIIRKNIDYVSYIRVLGEVLLIGSIFVSKWLRNIMGIIGITFIAFEMMVFHPVPLLDKEYHRWLLK